jgi:DNA primase
MKELTEFIKSVEFQTALFNNINTILPEYNFIQYSGKWMSPLNIDRSEPEHKKRDKTVITREVPGTMLENGEGGTLNILQYLTERDGKEIYETVVSICNTAGIKLPTSKEYDPEAYKRSQERADILDLCNGYFVYCLDTEANPVKEYLQDVRKYTPELYKKMGLGYIPGREKLFNYLKGKGYAQDDLDAVLNVKRDEAGNITGAWKVIGEVNKLTIPYIRSGALIGFNIRAVTPTDPKYKYMNTLKSGDKTPGFFNLPIVKECNDLVIVEGELDALHCKVMGINNVVAVGTNKISKEMVVEAVGAGYTSFTLCYDNDKGKDISKQIIKDIQNIQINSKYKVNRVNIASLPELDGDKVDPDRLIKEKGIDALKEVIATATPYYIYYLNKILDKYRLIREDRELNDTDVADLKAEVIKTAYNIPDPTDRDLFNNKFLNDPYVNKLGINKASLEEMEDRLRYDKDKDKLAQRLKKLLTDTEDGLKNGEAYKILDDLDKTVRDLKTAGADLPVILTYEGIIKEITDMPETYKTGYDKLDEYIGFKPGAITLIAGRPGHG